jgi:6-phosphogluconolactonase (cycloisomerase 2 family)
VTTILDPAEPHATIQTIEFPGITAGIDVERQTKSFPHQVLLDPTNRFLLTPDLGSDHVHVLRIEKGGKLRKLPSLNVPPGTGPRHATFWSPDSGSATNGDLYLVVVGELSGQVLVYKTDYLDLGEHVSALSFTLVKTTSALGRDDISKKFFPGEIALSVGVLLLIGQC